MDDARTELMDIVDENDNVIGCDTRENIHKNNQIYRSVDILIMNSEHKIIVQQRPMYKTGGGLWEISAGGHIKSKEEPLVAAHRELLEELGIDTDLEYVDKRRNPNNGGKEYIYLFVGKSDSTPNIDKEDVEEIRYVDMNELDEILKLNSHVTHLSLWRDEITKLSI